MKTKQNELQQAWEKLIKGEIKYKEFREIELKYIKKLLKGAKQ